MSLDRIDQGYHTVDLKCKCGSRFPEANNRNANSISDDSSIGMKPKEPTIVYISNWRQDALANNTAHMDATLTHQVLLRTEMSDSAGRTGFDSFSRERLEPFFRILAISFYPRFLFLV
jgi:hypothetical protein